MGYIDQHWDAKNAALLAQAAPLAQMGAFECDLRDDSLRWTDGVYDLFGIARDDRLDRQETVTLYTDAARAMLERVRAGAIAARSSFELEAEIVRPDGTHRWLRIRAAVRTANGRSTHLYGMKQDISADRQRVEDMRRRFEMDPLTTLPGRAPFQREFLDKTAVTADTALVLVDVDGFKLVNDTYGHAAGDACLAAVAKRLSRAFTGAAMIARIGGDEFAVVIDRSTSSCRLGAQTGAALRQITAPIVFGDQLLTISASAALNSAAGNGCATSAAKASPADAALYRAKRAGRNAYRVHPAQPSAA